MDIKELKPKYADISFGSKKTFDKWLLETTFMHIVFEDLGQDMQNIFIAQNGEILHCDFHARMYNGKFVNIEELCEFSPIEILINDEWVRMMGLIVEEIKLTNH